MFTQNFRLIFQSMREFFVVFFERILFVEQNSARKTHVKIEGGG
jgi:hypothetical protein